MSTSNGSTLKWMFLCGVLIACFLAAFGSLVYVAAGNTSKTDAARAEQIMAQVASEQAKEALALQQQKMDAQFYPQQQAIRLQDEQQRLAGERNHKALMQAQDRAQDARWEELKQDAFQFAVYAVMIAFGIALVLAVPCATFVITRRQAATLKPAVPPIKSHTENPAPVVHEDYRSNGRGKIIPMSAGKN